MIDNLHDGSSSIQDTKLDQTHLEDLIQKKNLYKQRLIDLVGEDYHEPTVPQKSDFHWDYVLKEAVSFFYHFVNFSIIVII